MFDKIIYFSLHNKLVVTTLLMAMIGWGVYNLTHLSLDAVPDITDNQVQVITSSPDLSAQEVERLITFPLEMELGNIPKIESIRSISRFGLSVITVVFEEGVDIYWAREQINQNIQKAKSNIPSGMGEPEMGPISTGLGEIYQYTLYPATGYEEQYSATELRSIQDWIIRRQLIGTPGVVEVNSSGGFVKQYEVAIQQNRLRAFGLTVQDVYMALAENNSNAGGSYIERADHTYFIRGEGIVHSTDDILATVVKAGVTAPITIGDVATVRIGHAPRFGAVTKDGKGEVVAGQVMMLKGENSMEVTKRVKARIEDIKKSLPVGVVLEPYLDRTKLVNRTTKTISKNLLEGALIVIFILVLMLGNFRAGLIVASVIPLSMLFAVSCMRWFGVSANLMSLGAIDFGLIVDGAVIMVEAILHHMGVRNKQRDLDGGQKSAEVYKAASNIRRSAAFGELIILTVYLPIFFLRGVEGKMFIPMAQTVSFAILGALILSMTYVPMMSDIFLKNHVHRDGTLSDKIMKSLIGAYARVRDFSFRFKYLVLVLVVFLFAISLRVFSSMGSEFIPTLEEGDFALHQILPPGSSIRKGVDVSAKLQDILTSKFPEVEQVVTKIGTAEIPTDIMPLEAGDIFVILKPKKEWTSASSREEMFHKMEAELSKFPGVLYEFTQPIQMRFNELMTGIRQDIALKIYGEDLGLLRQYAERAEALLQTIPGVGDINVEPTAGLQQMLVDYDFHKMAKYGVTVSQLNDVLRTSFAGKKAGIFYEGEKQYDIVVRLREEERRDLSSLEDLQVTVGGRFVPMSELATISFQEGPTQISRDDTKRRITIGVNARNIDIMTLVNQIKDTFGSSLDLPPGYHVSYGGQFENLQRANRTLGVVVPVALAIIFLLLYFTFHSARYALLIFVSIPLSAIGGIWSLYIRDMPFSISAGVGFIALFGVAVLNGIVLVGYFNQLKKEGMTNVLEIIRTGTEVRLRPVVMTAAVASLGFLPMAISTSAGAEVQQPLATVVIGGLITATFLTLIILPILYFLLETARVKVHPASLTVLMLLAVGSVHSQNAYSYAEIEEYIVQMEDDDLSTYFKTTNHSLAAMSKNPLAPLRWQMTMSGEEFNFSDRPGIRSLNIQHYFRLNKADQKMADMYQTYREINDVEYEISRMDFARANLAALIEASHLTSLIALESEWQDKLLVQDQHLRRKVALGETGSLEARRGEGMRMISEIEIDRLEGQRKAVLNAVSESVGIRVEEVLPLHQQIIDLPVDMLEEHPSLQRLTLQQNLVTQQTQVDLLQISPQLFTGLRLQSVNKEYLFYGAEVGVAMPLDGGYRKSQLEASALQMEALLANTNWTTKQISVGQKKLFEEVSILRTTLERIEEQISFQRQLLEDVSKTFVAGEISYAAMLIAFEKFYGLRRYELDQMKLYFIKINEIRHYVYN